MNSWRCIRQQTVVKEEEVKEEPVKPAAKPALSTGLSWDFGSSSSGSALSFNFGSTPSSNAPSSSTNSTSVSANADLLSLLSKMEKKTGATADSQAFSKPKSNPKPQSKSIPAEPSSHPQVPEMFIDVFLCLFAA